MEKRLDLSGFRFAESTKKSSKHNKSHIYDMLAMVVDELERVYGLNVEENSLDNAIEVIKSCKVKNSVKYKVLSDLESEKERTASFLGMHNESRITLG